MKQSSKYLLITIIMAVVISALYRADAQDHAHQHSDNCSHSQQKPDHTPLRSTSIPNEHQHNHNSDCSHDELHAEIELTAEQLKRSGIAISVAAPGKLDKTINLTGEISINLDIQTHHTARSNGIAQSVKANIGDYVRKDELLATIDSTELGQSKSEYYEIFNQVSISLNDLQRHKKVAEAVKKLINDLKKQPEPETIQTTAYGDMGEYRSILLSSYAEFITSQKAYNRRKKLFSDRIVSENDFLNARNSFEKAQAEFMSAIDNAAYTTERHLTDAEKIQQINEFKLRSAERKLLLLGMTQAEIGQIKEHGARIMQECIDPGCSDCSFSKEKHYHQASEDTFSQLEIRAKRSGTVIARKIEHGEEIEAGRTIFTIADLRRLWSILQVPARDINLVKTGMEVIISSHEGEKTLGAVDRIFPVIDQQTRTASIRVSFNNDNNRWFPGQFVTGTLVIAADHVPVVIEKHAVQNVNGNDMVFVKGEKGFRPADVKTGREDNRHVEIISGLKAGENYVSEGAFALKSVMVTSGIDPHAGHGH